MNPSSYLKPQVVIEDPLKQLTSKAFYLTQEKAVKDVLQSPLPENWSSFIISLKPERIIDSLPAEVREDAPYTWEQNGTTIKIKFNDKIQITKDNIIVDTNSINSSVISGNFLYPLEAPPIITSNFEIVLTVDRYWPVVISGGDNIDGFSAYLLSEISIKNKQIELFYYWGTKSAASGFVIAQKTLAFNYLYFKQYEQSMFWFTKLASSTNDEFSRIVIAQYLFEATDSNADPILAENILVDLAKDGSKDSIYYLGYLHLQKLKNWNNDEKLAVEYLKESCEKHDDKLAMRLLAECYANGQGCERNMREGLKYAHRAQKTIIKEKIKKNETSYLSAIGMAAAIIGTVTCGVYIAKRFFRRR